MRVAILVVVLIILAGGTYFLITRDYDNNPGMTASSDANYTNISVSELEKMIKNKDFKLVDVHIPEQQHIPGTDKMIAYNNVDDFISQFSNKDEKIVLYCRSGSMSEILAKELIQRGYTNIYK